MNLGLGSKERRQHPRVAAERRVAMLCKGAWHDCVIVDASSGGAAIRTVCRPEIGKPVIVHIAELGLFKCRVVRHTEDGVAAAFEAADFGIIDTKTLDAEAAASRAGL